MIESDDETTIGLVSSSVFLRSSSRLSLFFRTSLTPTKTTMATTPQITPMMMYRVVWADLGSEKTIETQVALVTVNILSFGIRVTFVRAQTIASVKLA